MKEKVLIVVIFVSTILLVWVTLITNRIQRICVDSGDIVAGLKKVSFTVNELAVKSPIRESMIECHASAGGILILSCINFLLLSTVIIVIIRKRKNS